MRFTTGLDLPRLVQADQARVDWPVLICLLGSFRLLKAGQPVALRNASKTRALLANLALEPGYCVSREALLQAIWPDADATLASQSLNSLVYSLRKLLGDQIGGEPPVLHADGFYRLNVDAGVGVDAAWFEALVNAGEQLARSGDQSGAIAQYTYAAQLYQGDLCAVADIQIVVEREYLRALYLTLLARLADYHFSRGDCLTCMGYALRLLSVDPCREDAHRLVMRCHVHQGERAQALRQYQLCASILRAEFEAEPETETTDLYNQIRLQPDAA